MSQRLLFNREREAGAYRTSAFYLADLLCRLPQHLIAVFFYSIIILYLADIHGTLNENGAFLLLVNTVVMQIYLGINETVGMYSCPPLTLISSIADWLILGACMSEDRKSTRLNSSHSQISYAVFCLDRKSVV